MKVCANDQDPSLLDGFPLYWVHKGNKDAKESFRRPRSPDNMGELDKDLCLFWKKVVAANITFPTSSIISFEFSEGQLEAHRLAFTSTLRFSFCVGTDFASLLSTIGRPACCVLDLVFNSCAICLHYSHTYSYILFLLLCLLVYSYPVQTSCWAKAN